MGPRETGPQDSFFLALSYLLVGQEPQGQGTKQINPGVE